MIGSYLPLKCLFFFDFFRENLLLVVLKETSILYDCELITIFYPAYLKIFHLLRSVCFFLCICNIVNRMDAGVIQKVISFLCL